MSYEGNNCCEKDLTQNVESQKDNNVPAGSLQTLVTNQNNYKLSFSTLTHSLGSNEMNYSAETQSKSHFVQSEQKRDEKCHSLADLPHIKSSFSGNSGVQQMQEYNLTAGDETSKDTRDDYGDESQWEDVKQEQQCYDSYNAESPRQFNKLSFDPNLSQQKRREHTLQWQKSRRGEILDKIRNLESNSSYSDSETDEGLDFVKHVKQGLRAKNHATGEQSMEEEYTFKNTRRKNKSNRYTSPLTVMLSEWFIEKPEDFEEKWVGVLCPVGKRCLVVASRGKTKIYSRRDYYLGGYASELPGGSKGGYCVSGNRSRGVTILDCLWSEQSQVFYVLDLVCWNSHPCTNCDTDYRQFFLASKFQENDILLKRNNLNPFPFIPLPYFTADNFTAIMTSMYPPFPENIDGVLFFHKESFYISEINPLCLWLRLSDVDRRLGTTVAPELMAKEEPLQDKQRYDKRRKSKPSKSVEMVES